YKPETKIKYSNAAIATVGYVLEKTQKEEFTAYLERTLLQPLGLKHSSFAPRKDLMKDLAKATMWTYHGREFPAPTFELGMPPAGSMYTSVLDLGQFLSVLFAEGRGPSAVLLKPETLRQMWTPQFAKPGDRSGFGIGFMIDERQRHKRIGHGGAIYGFSTQLTAIPDAKLGVVVVASKDVVNTVTTR